MANFDTIRIRSGYKSLEHNWAVQPPIYQTASFDLGSLDRAQALWGLDIEDSIYTRIGNPTVSVLERRVAALDDAHGLREWRPYRMSFWR